MLSRWAPPLGQKWKGWKRKAIMVGGKYVAKKAIGYAKDDAYDAMERGINAIHNIGSNARAWDQKSSSSAASSSTSKRGRFSRAKEKVKAAFKRKKPTPSKPKVSVNPPKSSPFKRRTRGLSRGEKWSAAAAAAASAAAEQARSALEADGDVVMGGGRDMFGGAGGNVTEWGHTLARIRTSSKQDKRKGRAKKPRKRDMKAFKRAYTLLVRPTMVFKKEIRTTLVSKFLEQHTGPDLQYSRAAWGFYPMGSLSEYRDALVSATNSWTDNGGIFTPPTGYIEKGANVHFHETVNIMNDATIPQFYTVWECNFKNDWDESARSYPAGGSNPSELTDRTSFIGEYACEWDELTNPPGPAAGPAGVALVWDDIQANLKDSAHWNRTFTIGKKYEFKLGAGEVMKIERDCGGTFDFDEYDLLQKSSIDYLQGRSKVLVIKVVGMFVRDPSIGDDGDQGAIVNKDTGDSMLQNWTKSHIIRLNTRTVNVRTTKPKMRKYMDASARKSALIANNVIGAGGCEYVGNEQVGIRAPGALGVSNN